MRMATASNLFHATTLRRTAEMQSSNPVVYSEETIGRGPVHKIQRSKDATFTLEDVRPSARPAPPITATLGIQPEQHPQGMLGSKYAAGHGRDAKKAKRQIGAWPVFKSMLPPSPVAQCHQHLPASAALSFPVSHVVSGSSLFPPANSHCCSLIASGLSPHFHQIAAPGPSPFFSC